MRSTKESGVTVGLVSATFRKMSNFALYPPPGQNNTKCRFCQSLGTLVLFSQEGEGGTILQLTMTFVTGSLACVAD